MPRLRCFESCAVALVLLGLSCGGSVDQTTAASGDAAVGDAGGHAGSGGQTSFGGYPGSGGAATGGEGGSGSDLDRCGPRPPGGMGCVPFCGYDVSEDFVCFEGVWICPAGTQLASECPLSTCWGPHLPCWKCDGEFPEPVGRDCTYTTECPPGSSEVPCDMRDVDGGGDGGIDAAPPSCGDAGCDAAAE